MYGELFKLIELILLFPFFSNLKNATSVLSTSIVVSDPSNFSFPLANPTDDSGLITGTIL